MPVFIKVMACDGVVPTGTLPKLMLVGEGTASGPAPVPSNARTWGFPGAESLTLKNAPSMPTTLAANCISKAHDDPALIGDAKQGSGLTAEKSPLFAPVMLMLETERGASPVFIIATGNCALFGTPTGCDPKFTLAELNDTLGLAAALDVIFTTNASFSGGDCWQLAHVIWIPFIGFPARGKSAVDVAPATYTLADESTAIAFPLVPAVAPTGAVPPSGVEYSSEAAADEVGSSFVTNAAESPLNG